MASVLGTPALRDCVEGGKVSLVLVGLPETLKEFDKMKMSQLQRLMILTQLIWGGSGSIPGILVKSDPGSIL